MKILLYGFKPFLQYSENITEKIIANIKYNNDIKKIIFDVLFDENIFKDAIKNYKPDFIIGMGQYPRGKKIRIERTAYNEKRNSKKERSSIISKKYPEKLYATLKLASDNNSRITYNAGRYVCNFSMFTCLSYTKNTCTKYAFLHIPKDIEIKKGVDFVEKALKNLKDL